MTPFHGGFGLLNYQSISKPAFYAYKFLNRLGDTELKCSNADAWVTKDEHGGVHALVWNCTYTHPGKSVNNQVFYTRDHPPSSSTRREFTVQHLPAGRYGLTIHRVGYRSNDAHATYLDLGSPSQLSRQQVAFIKARNDGAPSEQTVVSIGADGSFRHTVEVRENDLCLIELVPL
jgi:xylan 1,4-beta-xylosidase